MGSMRFILAESELEVVGLLAKSAGYQCLAGGGLLVPSLRGDVVPVGVISLRKIVSLHGISQDETGIRIGAMVTHAEVMGSEVFRDGHLLVRLAAGEIAHPAVRNMATIGGTLCRADPSADYCCALLAAGAVVHLASSGGERTIDIDAFFLADGGTTRREDELLVAVSIEAGENQTSGYARFSRVDGDYPAVTAAARLDWAAGRIAAARVAIGGCGPRAYRVAEAEHALIGLANSGPIPNEVYEAFVAAAQPPSDLRGSADYRRMLIPGLLRRAIGQALALQGHVQ